MTEYEEQLSREREARKLRREWNEMDEPTRKDIMLIDDVLERNAAYAEATGNGLGEDLLAAEAAIETAIAHLELFWEDDASSKQVEDAAWVLKGYINARQ